MGLIEYVPALITFDYLIVAINNDEAAEIARYIHSHSKKTCGIFTAYNTEYDILLQLAKNQHKRVVNLYKNSSGTYPMDHLRALFGGTEKEIHIPVSSASDGTTLAFLIGNRTP